jgi:hypothetical protein
MWNRNPIKGSLSQRLKMKASLPWQQQESQSPPETRRTATAEVFADAAAAAEAAVMAGAMAVIEDQSVGQNEE